ncbi:MAG: hypothetical protein IH905_03200 [Proteobacteria bacterium]|nr:hypothetical protein [Pseudomonadota bacterium]
MSERGPDGAGVAIYRHPVPEGHSKLTLFHPDPDYPWEKIVILLAEGLGVEAEVAVRANHALLIMDADGEPPRVWLAANAPGIRIMGYGQTMEVYKDMGPPREVVAQALDYASWVEKLHAEDIAAIYGRFGPGRSLAQDFREYFGQDLDEETLNQNHQIIIVAGSLDDSTERIVSYLSERDIPINVLCFQVFTNGDEQ